nr:uncharacterized protein K02A2.6-like [Penaeus vannamei]
MNFVLSSVLGHHTLAYLDDVIVYSRGFSQHLKDLEETLQLLAAAGLKLNIEKCKFAATTINFLGFTISPEGVSPHQDKVATILATPAPQTVKEVRRFWLQFCDSQTSQPFELHRSIDCEALVVVEGVTVFDSYLYDQVFDLHRPSSSYVWELSSQELALEQRQDLAHQDILSYLSDGTVPKKKPPVSLSDFEMKDGVLYRLLHLPDKIVYQLCVPERLRDSALKAEQCRYTSTYENLRNMFTGPICYVMSASMLNIACVSSQEGHPTCTRYTSDI